MYFAGRSATGKQSVNFGGSTPGLNWLSAYFPGLNWVGVGVGSKVNREVTVMRLIKMQEQKQIPQACSPAGESAGFLTAFGMTFCQGVNHANLGDPSYRANIGRAGNPCAWRDEGLDPGIPSGPCRKKVDAHEANKIEWKPVGSHSPLAYKS
jgi:hypothetical protein